MSAYFATKKTLTKPTRYGSTPTFCQAAGKEYLCRPPYYNPLPHRSTILKIAPASPKPKRVRSFKFVVSNTPLFRSYDSFQDELSQQSKPQTDKRVIRLLTIGLTFFAPIRRGEGLESEICSFATDRQKPPEESSPMKLLITLIYSLSPFALLVLQTPPMQEATKMLSLR